MLVMDSIVTLPTVCSMSPKCLLTEYSPVPECLHDGQTFAIVSISTQLQDANSPLILHKSLTRLSTWFKAKAYRRSGNFCH